MQKKLLPRSFCKKWIWFVISMSNIPTKLCLIYKMSKYYRNTFPDFFAFLAGDCETGQTHHDPDSENMECMMTLSNGNIFCITGLLCGNSLVTGEFPAQRPVTWSFEDFFDLHLNKRLSKQQWGWWFEMPLWSWWRHCNDVFILISTPFSLTFWRRHDADVASL